MADPEGLRGGGGFAWTPCPPPFWNILSLRPNYLIFMGYFFEKWDKISKANPNTFIHMYPFLRNPGYAPGRLIYWTEYYVYFYKIAGFTWDDSQCMWIHLSAFTIFVNAWFSWLQMLNIDTCDWHVYALIGNSDISLLLFIKGHIDKLSMQMGCFNIFERSCWYMLLTLTKYIDT